MYIDACGIREPFILSPGPYEVGSISCDYHEQAHCKVGFKVNIVKDVLCTYLAQLMVVRQAAQRTSSTHQSEALLGMLLSRT